MFRPPRELSLRRRGACDPRGRRAPAHRSRQPCQSMPTASCSAASRDLRSADHPARRQGPGQALCGLRLWRADRRARGRHAARHRQARQDHRRARCRQGDQPDAGRRPDRRRHRARHRHGADGGIHPRPHRESARLPDPDHRRRAADRDDPRRGRRSRGAVRRQGAGRARADPDRAGDPQCHPPCDRRAGHHSAGDADPRAGGDQAGGGAGDERACRTLRHARSRRAAGRREDPLRCLPGHVLHRRRPHRRLRPLRQSRRPHRAPRPADHPRTCASCAARQWCPSPATPNTGTASSSTAAAS